MSKSQKVTPRFLTELESNYLYIKQQFERLAAFMEGKSSGEMHPDDDATVYEYGSLYSLLSIKQPMSQEQMKWRCERIEENRRKDKSPLDSFIDFERNVHLWNEATSYGCGICDIEVLGGISECFDINVDTRLKLHIYIGETDAYMKAKSDHGDVYYFELNRFSMLYNEINEPGADHPFSEPGNGPAREHGTGVIVVFDKSRKLSHTSEFLLPGFTDRVTTACDESPVVPESTAETKEDAS